MILSKIILANFKRNNKIHLVHTSHKTYENTTIIDTLLIHVCYVYISRYSVNTINVSVENVRCCSRRMPKKMSEMFDLAM